MGASTKRGVRSYVVVAVAAMLLGGGGWALAAPGNGTLHACASKRDGALRLAAGCGKGERAVSWNAQGRPGANGSTGATGPSDIYAAGSGSGTLSGADYTTVVTITVPPGSYLIGGKISFTTGADVIADCVLSPPTDSKHAWDEAGTYAPPAQGGPWYGSVSLVGADRFTSAQTIALRCLGISTNPSPPYSAARVWALKTGNLHAALPLATQ